MDPYKITLLPEYQLLHKNSKLQCFTCLIMSCLGEVLNFKSIFSTVHRENRHGQSIYKSNHVKIGVNLLKIMADKELIETGLTESLD